MGIPPDKRERIFDPFLTTKDPGEGTGLGLAICREIANLHRGTLTAECPSSGGAEFILTLPLIGAEEIFGLESVPSVLN
jgi:two-component system NtrC family sensor kinase